MFDLSGRVALVTGGNGGIGLGLAKGLAACGARVVVTGRDKDKNDAALAELGGDSHAIVADLSQPGETDRVLAETLALGGGLAILVNNAGTNLRAPPHEVTDEQWNTVLEINLNAMMRLTRAAYPALKASGHGRVINTGSMLSIFGVLFSPAYGASKGAVVQYTKSLAVAWAKDGITANSILPGWIDTDLTRRARQYSSTLHDSVLNRTPMGRWGDPKDFIGIAAFLASDEAAFITGTAIPIDGGFSTQG
ncbi:SDR family NAD(P)-dependent oxidoreductase [Roseococcus sp. YIM B11640]|uniref:SDR family NAD(P)-dependent oxidoreductase n=1 Tax=Roseococcus sp. YIM B11640 TaxID=3133973 RepID=UPI003C7B53AC